MNLIVTGIDLCHAATILVVERRYRSSSHELTWTGLSSRGQKKRFWSLGTQVGRHHYLHRCRLNQSLLWLTHLRASFHNALSSIDQEHHIGNVSVFNQNHVQDYSFKNGFFDFTCFIEIFIVFLLFFLLQNWVKCTLTSEHLFLQYFRPVLRSHAQTRLSTPNT